MYRYSDNNENNDISLHDCRANKILIGEKSISFIFRDGFYVTDKNSNNYNKTLSYTDKSEVIFKMPYHVDTDMTVYIFSKTDKEDTAIRKEISANQLADRHRVRIRISEITANGSRHPLKIAHEKRRI